jgi:hypothetical protein
MKKDRDALMLNLKITKMRHRGKNRQQIHPLSGYLVVRNVQPEKIKQSLQNLSKSSKWMLLSLTLSKKLRRYHIGVEVCPREKNLTMLNLKISFKGHSNYFREGE